MINVLLFDIDLVAIVRTHATTSPFWASSSGLDHLVLAQTAHTTSDDRLFLIAPSTPTVRLGQSIGCPEPCEYWGRHAPAFLRAWSRDYFPHRNL